MSDEVKRHWDHHCQVEVRATELLVVEVVRAICVLGSVGITVFTLAILLAP